MIHRTYILYNIYLFHKHVLRIFLKINILYYYIISKLKFINIKNV